MVTVNAGLKGAVKKTTDSFKAAAKIWPKFTSGINQARDYTGLLSKKTGAFLTNATEGTRKHIAAKNILISGYGRLKLAIETTALRFKLFKAGAIKGFTQMIASQNRVIAGFGQMGLAMMMANPILLIIGLIVGAFVLMYTTNEKFRKQIDAVFKPALEALGEAFRVIMLALQPVILAFQKLMSVLFGGSDGKGGPLTMFFVMLAEVVSMLVQALAPLIADLISKLMPIVEMLINLLIPIVEVFMKIQMAIMSFLLPILKFVIEIVVQLIKTLTDWLMPVIDAVMAYLMPLFQFWQQMIELIGASLRLCFLATGINLQWYSAT